MGTRKKNVGNGGGARGNLRERELRGSWSFHPHARSSSQRRVNLKGHTGREGNKEKWGGPALRDVDGTTRALGQSTPGQEASRRTGAGMAFARRAGCVREKQKTNLDGKRTTGKRAGLVGEGVGGRTGVAHIRAEKHVVTSLLFS